MNTTIHQKEKPANSGGRIININHHALDMVAIAAISPMSEAIFTLAVAPLQLLSRLHGMLRAYYKRNREQDSIDLLYFIFGVLGIDYADIMLQLREKPAARSYFVYQFISSLGELIEELEEKSTDRNNKRGDA